MAASPKDDVLIHLDRIVSDNVVAQQWLQHLSNKLGTEVTLAAVLVELQAILADLQADDNATATNQATAIATLASILTELQTDDSATDTTLIAVKDAVEALANSGLATEATLQSIESAIVASRVSRETRLRHEQPEANEQILYCEHTTYTFVGLGPDGGDTNTAIWDVAVTEYESNLRLTKIGMTFLFDVNWDSLCDVNWVLDETPDAFSLSGTSGVDPNYTHNESVVITGINVPVDVSVTGDMLWSLDGITYGTAPGQISNGETLYLSMVAPGTLDASSTGTVTVGTVTESMTVATRTSFAAYLSGLGAVAFWPLDSNDDGVTAYDIVGGANGTYQGATQGTELVSGAGNAASFDGVDDYIDISSNISSLIANLPAQGAEMSFECTVNKDLAQSNAHVFEFRGWNGANEVSLGYWRCDSVNNQFNLFNPAQLSVAMGTNNIPTTGLVHVVVTWKSSTGTFKVYKDGALQGTGTDTAGSTIPWEELTALHIGAGGDYGASSVDNVTAPSEFMDGRISHVGIYNRELTAAEVEDRYAARQGPPAEITLAAMNCVAFWRLNEGSGTQATEIIGAKHGTYVGATHGAELVAGAGTAASFDGVNDRIDLGAWDPFNELGATTDEMSIEATILQESGGVTGQPVVWFSKSTNGTNPSMGLRASGNVAQMTGQASTPGGTTNNMTGGATSFGKAEHYILTFSKSNDRLRLYRNGVLVDERIADPATGASITWTDNVPHVLGTEYDNFTYGPDYFKGRISHVGVFSKELTEEEVLSRYFYRAGS